MEKAHNVLLKFPVMWAISKWPVLMRLPRVIRKLMVSQIISLCQLITLLRVGSACDYCLAGISSSTPYIQNNGKWWNVGLFLLGVALSSFPGRWQSWCSAWLCIPPLPHTCPNPLHNPNSKCLGWLLRLAQRSHFTEHLSPKRRINTVLKLNFFSVIYFHVLITSSCGV